MTHDNTQDLLKVSLQIEEIIKKMEGNYELVSKKLKDFDFFKDVKPFVDIVEQLTSSWREAAMGLLEERSIKYIFQEQIDQTVENLNILAVIHFQEDTRHKRFVDLIASVKYIVGKLIAEISKEQ